MWKVLGGILSSSSAAQQSGASQGRLRGAQAQRGRRCFRLPLTLGTFTSRRGAEPREVTSVPDPLLTWR